MKKFITVLSLIWMTFTGQIAFGQTNQWRPVSGARHDNISGMALVEHESNKTIFIIVNDNKKPEQNHTALVTIEGRGAPKYQPLKWSGNDAAVDFEAISSVPDKTNNFMALTADGRVFYIVLNRADNSVKIVKSFDVPKIPSEHDFEGFALQKVNGNLLAVWADRGLDQKPAQIFWSRFDLGKDEFTGETNSSFLKVPFPIGKTRHISDLKIDDTGGVFISSASDPGNDGPFASAIYYAGVFSINFQQIEFKKSASFTRLFTFDYHKIEAIEFVPGENGGIAFGTDDENLGAAIYMDW